MRLLPRLFANNRAWSQRIKSEDPEFFARLARQQAPEFLWIGCSDSRVPANQVVGLLPGEVFVHRNVANQVQHTDFNCLSVLQYAVDILKVKHVIVCGHYGCGGVRAALEGRPLGLVDHWLRHVQDLYHHHASEVDALAGEARVDRMCELNVVEQVGRLARATVVQETWRRGEPLHLHGWIYGLSDGLLRDLGVACSSDEEAQALQRRLERPQA
ncbi:MAG: carbonate dehydratase [Planctomycetes bacterium]|nr:carbonate dehydratase [Planctomycetota bacterium]